MLIINNYCYPVFSRGGTREKTRQKGGRKVVKGMKGEEKGRLKVKEERQLLKLNENELLIDLENIELGKSEPLTSLGVAKLGP